MQSHAKRYAKPCQAMQSHAKRYAKLQCLPSLAVPTMPLPPPLDVQSLQVLLPCGNSPASSRAPVQKRSVVDSPPPSKPEGKGREKRGSRSAGSRLILCVSHAEEGVKGKAGSKADGNKPGNKPGNGTTRRRGGWPECGGPGRGAWCWQAGGPQCCGIASLPAEQSNCAATPVKLQ